MTLGRMTNCNAHENASFAATMNVILSVGIMINVILLNIIQLYVIVLKVILLNVILMNIILLNVILA